SSVDTSTAEVPVPVAGDWDWDSISSLLPIPDMDTAAASPATRIATPVHRSPPSDHPICNPLPTCRKRFTFISYLYRKSQECYLQNISNKKVECSFFQDLIA